MTEIEKRQNPRPPRESFFPESHCHECLWPRFVKTRRSTFLYCRRLRTYPPQPVRRCEAFEQCFEA
jgi:hypothetical protein